MTKAALYARVSTRDKNQDPENQLLQLRRYCEYRDVAIYKEYVDKARATDMRRRKEWANLIKDAAAGRFDMVIAWKLDRVYRDPLNLLKALEDFHQMGINLVLTEDNYDGNTIMGKAMLLILALFAEIEVDKLREKVEAAQELRRSKGLPVSRPRLEHIDPKLTAQLNETFAQLDSNSTNITQSAKKLKISRSVLSRRYKEYRNEK